MHGLRQTTIRTRDHAGPIFSISTCWTLPNWSACSRNSGREIAKAMIAPGPSPTTKVGEKRSTDLSVDLIDVIRSFLMPLIFSFVFFIEKV